MDAGDLHLQLADRTTPELHQVQLFHEAVPKWHSVFLVEALARNQLLHGLHRLPHGQSGVQLQNREQHLRRSLPEIPGTPKNKGTEFSSRKMRHPKHALFFLP